MSNEELVILAEKIEIGSATERDLILYNAVCSSFQQQDVGLEMMEVELQEREDAGLRKFWDSQNNPKVKKQLLWPRWASIAAALVVITFGIWFYTSRNLNTNGHPELVSGTHDITPGKNTATLSFNGRSMQLSEAKTGVKIDNDKLTYNDGSSLPANGGVSGMVTATTPRGGTYQFVLEDGTRVWLNADSKLEFYSSYKNKAQRLVKLDGEGYFEVAKDKAHPFIVQTGNQEVEVLGTHFNINSYNNEPAIVTTLIEGSVKVRSGQNNQLLKPGYQAINNGDAIKVTAANIENIMDWQKGDFYLDQIDFRTAMRKISRWYNVDVVYDASVPQDIESGGWISRSKNLSAVLEFIERSGQVHFRLEGRTVYVSK